MNKTHDLIIIGGGQSALACAYYLRRTDIDYTILDKSESCGGSWQSAWDSLTLFSPAEHSSLPGWLMPSSSHDFPTKEEVIDYLCKYEQRYNIQIQRPVEVFSAVKQGDLFELRTSSGTMRSKALISATGTWGKPFIPEVKGKERFNGVQIHSSEYRNPDFLKNKKVLVVGEGNSGAQILAEVSEHANTVWATREEPDFLPDDVDGRVLFDVASAKYYAEKKGEKFDPSKYNLGHIVMVPTVKEARDRKVLGSRRTFAEMTESGVVWPDGTEEEFEVVIWCTGFGYATAHLKNLVETDLRGKIKTDGTRSKEIPGLWLVGYGGWTGFASATIIGVGRSAKKTIGEVQDFLKKAEQNDSGHDI
ncbi:ArsO family NAD(P)H-dependent flavin-containing monooxygenase [Halocola ammonii]